MAGINPLDAFNDIDTAQASEERFPFLDQAGEYGVKVLAGSTGVTFKTKAKYIKLTLEVTRSSNEAIKVGETRTHMIAEDANNYHVKDMLNFLNAAQLGVPNKEAILKLTGKEQLGKGKELNLKVVINKTKAGKDFAKLFYSAVEGAVPAPEVIAATETPKTAKSKSK